MPRLFVYGTLMRGESNAGHLSPARGCVFVAEARTTPYYTLLDLGMFPALLPTGTTAVAGELWDVDAAALGRLDEFEEHPTLYCRAPVDLFGGQPAVAYFLVAPPGPAARPIPSGDWRRRRLW